MNETAGAIRETTLRDFLAVIFRRAGIILTVLLAALVTVLIMAGRAKPQYASTARVLVSRGEPESVYNSRTKLLSWDEELNSEIEIISSSTIGERAQKVLTDAGAVDSRGRPIRFNPMKVKANTSGRASVILVTYTGSDPIEAREGLRGLIRAYTEWRTQQRSLPIVDGFFQEELESLRDQLAQWEQRRADFMSDEGIVNITTERESLLRQKESAQNQLTISRARMADYAARLEAIQSLQMERRIDPTIDIFGLSDAETNDEDLLSILRKERVLRQTDYFQKRSRLTDDHPEVLAAKDTYDRLSAQFDVEIENYTRFLDARISVARARVNSLETTVRAMDDELVGLPDKEARLAQYDRILDALKTDYKTMVERQVAAKAETSGRPEWSVILLQPASTAMRMRTRDIVRLALVPAFAIVIGLALAFVIDGLDHSLKDPSEVETHLKLPVLGSLSKLR